jgi:peptidoglycan/xylan/chitin deacetylase (PgdA/CDA1 family)
MFALIPPLAESHAETSPAQPPRGCDHGYVALTFDDGPSTTTTAILQALRDNGLTRATFFNIGAQEQLHPDLVLAEQAAGERPGDHTYSHPFLDELTLGEAAGEILGTQQIHEQITGVREALFRPPFGRTTPEIRAIARSMGMTEVLWTIDTQDYAGATTAQIVATALTAHRGDIILMHDAGYATTVAAVPQIIRGLGDRGICAGRVVPTRHPVTAWPGTTFFATAARW